MRLPNRARTERRGWWPWLLALLLAGCGGAATGADGTDGEPRLLVISSLNGYVEPCGCTIDLLLGGIDRIATIVAEERARGPTAVVVVGPHLFGGAVEPHMVGQEEAKARLIARSLAAMGVDAVVPTAAELARGPDFYRALRTEWPLTDVTANVPLGAGRIVALGTLKVGLFGLADPAAPPGPMGAATDPESAARAASETLRAAGASVVVALGALPRPTLRRLAQSVPGVDLWVLGHEPHEEPQVSPALNTFVVEAGDRGRNVGRIVLHDAARPGPLTDPAGERARKIKALSLQIKMRNDLFQRTRSPDLEASIASLEAERAALEQAPAEKAGKRLEYTLVPVAKEIEPRSELAGWLADYNEQLKAINLAAAGEAPPVPPGGSGYAGGAACVDCHIDADDVWKDTPHAKAWDTLVKAGKTFDAECVSCHVTGWRQPGGAVLGRLNNLENVQCEVCHGPGQVHVASGGDDASTSRTVPEAVCVQCHNKQHSPKFDYATYLPRVLGPGHQRK